MIVPLHRRSPAFDLSIERVARIAGDGHQVLVVSDEDRGPLPPGATQLLTGATHDTSPAEKRDLALAHATGAVCAFLDDDAYPRDDWLERALARFAADPTVAGVGGPGLTPPGSGWRERASGAFYESRLGSGALRFRFVQSGTVRDVDDLPAYNFLVRTDALRAVGGWGSRFYGGEDTKVCLQLVRSGHRLVYDPDVVVFHYRRPILAQHLRQVANVGRHRGYFARTLPETSRRAVYFAPTAALGAALVLLPVVTRSRRAAAGAAAGAAAAWAAVSVSALREGHDAAVAAVLPGVIATSHLAYGLHFARGFATPRIDAM